MFSNNTDAKTQLYLFIKFLTESKNKNHKGLIQQKCDDFINKLKKEIKEEIINDIKHSK
jgi:hypothetical protein